MSKEFILKDSHDLLEMARIGKIGNIEIMVYEGEGPIPHFHFYDKQTERKGCIRLDSPEYFIHGIYKDKLDRKEKKNLIRWLESPETPFKKFGVDISIYRYIIIMWNENNEDYRIDDDRDMPNYINLN